MGSTFDPPKLTELAGFWTAQHGVNLGITGDTRHAKRGVSYHLGKGDLIDTAYSIQSARDRTGLSKAASAIDLGRLDGTLENLQAFSRWLVRRCLADSKVRRDIREIIYAPNGTKIQRYSGIDNKIHTGPGNGDLSHRTHTHISYFRDSEFNDKVAPFAPFFVAGWADDVPPQLQAVDPGAKKVALAIRRTDHDFGAQVNFADLKEAFARLKLSFGTVMDPGDVMALIKS